MAFNVGFVLFPNLTQLDFTSTLQVLHRLPGSQTYIVAKTRDPVQSDCLGLTPTATFDDCPTLDLICVPGGFGVSGAIVDQPTIEFVRRQGAQAKYVTSVCTGAFVLGVAGLLKGRRATTHWAYTSLLPLVGATYEKARVVQDGHVFTGGGVTAGIDFALTLAEIAGTEAAQRIQLSIEYDPAPPLSAGHPDKAPAEVRDHIAPYYAKRTAEFTQDLQAALRKQAA